MRGDGDRCPELGKVELGGRELSSVGCEIVTRESTGREDEGGVGGMISLQEFRNSIVLSGLFRVLEHSLTSQGFDKPRY